MVSSTLSYLMNFMRCTIIVNQHSISYAGLFALFLSMLFRGISNLLLAVSLMNGVIEIHKIVLFSPLIILSLEIIFSSFFKSKLLQNYFPVNLVSVWTSIAGQKNDWYCFLGKWNKEKVFRKLNMFKISWFIFFAGKFVIYVVYLILAKTEFNLGFLFYFLLAGSICEIFSNIFRLFYFRFCHVWKDILPVKTPQKRDFKIFKRHQSMKQNLTNKLNICCLNFSKNLTNAFRLWKILSLKFFYLILM